MEHESAETDVEHWLRERVRVLETVAQVAPVRAPTWLRQRLAALRARRDDGMATWLALVDPPP